jgi:hypothetical protein
VHESHPSDGPMIYLILIPALYILPKEIPETPRAGMHVRKHCSDVITPSGIKGK